MTPTIRFACYGCDAEVRASFPGRAACARCGREEVLGAGVEGGRLAACPLCGAPDLYETRLFPPATGLAVVVVFAAFSFYLYATRDSVALALLPLAAAVLLDAALYRLLPPVVVCYLCRSFLEGVPRSGVASFDSEVGLRYEFLREKFPPGAPPRYRPR